MGEGGLHIRGWEADWSLAWAERSGFSFHNAFCFLRRSRYGCHCKSVFHRQFILPKLRISVGGNGKKWRDGENNSDRGKEMWGEQRQ